MFDEVKKLLTTNFEVPDDRVTAQATLQDLDLDSLDVVEFAEILAEQFGARITDDELLELDRLDKILELLESRSVPA